VNSRLPRLLSRRLRLAIVLVAAITSSALAATPALALPPIRHVFIIVLENRNFDTSFGPGSPAPYLARTLPSQGQLLPQYYGIGHESMDNYDAMISGQGPNPDTQADCQFYSDVAPGTIGADGQAAGAGCVYPAPVLTVANQLEARGLTWRAYMEDMGNSTTEPKVCRHPALNSQDDTQSAHLGDQYAARHDPFVYFHSIIDNTAGCDANVVPLDRLASDLRSEQSTPNYVFITPNLCHDGHDSPCVDGQPGGLVSADAFLRQWVPEILQSAAYQDGGLLAVIFDESASGAEACCNEQAANTPNAGGPTQGPGGGRVGAVLLSSYIQPGSVNTTPYNHYSLLRSVEDLFGLSHLGYAGKSDLKGFGGDVFNATPSAGGPTPTPAPPSGPVSCQSTRVRRGARGRLAPGTLIGSSRLARSGNGTLLLQVTMSHAATLRIRVSGRAHTRPIRRRVRACHTYNIKLPAGTRRVTLVAAFHRARETRSVSG
jgi:hypothetical protein